MKKLMRLDKAIEKKIVNNLDKVDPNALFPKRPNKVTLASGYTGVHETQEIQRQDFDYVLFKTRVKRDIILSILTMGKKECRNATVELLGRTGYRWSSECWKEINTLYTNRANGISAYPLNEEDLKLLFDRNRSFKGFKCATWIDECYREVSSEADFAHITKSGVKFVKERTILKKDLCSNYHWFGGGKFDYCPYLHICGPKDILVVLNSKKKHGKWKLIPRKGLLKWWYRLF